MAITRVEKVMGEQELKLILKEFNWNEPKMEDILINSMLAHIGSTDSELRDNLIYTSLYRMIVEHKQLDHPLLEEIVDKCMNELIMKGLGETETDSVFTRSFSTLLMALILHRDHTENFLTPQRIDEIKSKLLIYLEQENDIRGYVPVKGWAHSIAHVADTFFYLVKNEKLEKNSYSEIMRALWSKIGCSESLYLHDEDERILVPIIEMLERGIDVSVVEGMIDDLPSKLKISKEKLKEENYWILVSNYKNFLKSFYVVLQEKSVYPKIQRTILNILPKC